ncbi:hypothetical protein DPMN_056182 [Dreissena polymorpha]|uniref:Uncharacterized protein n=1 Tax=Dreissena polymorpha TaxID=45954 RepID=A0A9D4CSR3_DREPO|nr:hypothetical protein DPMN_056182 [Dreissena polymorpha]
MRPSALLPKFIGSGLLSSLAQFRGEGCHSWPSWFREQGIDGLLGQICWVAIWQSVPDGRFLSGTFFGEI